MYVAILALSVLFGSFSSPGDGIVRITLLTQVKKDRKERNFRPGIEPGSHRQGVQYTSHQAITQNKS